MRIIGIDYGSKRIGVAISDEAGQFALPEAVVDNSPALLAEIEKTALQHTAKEIVIGESRQYDMTPNKILPDILAFKAELESRGFTVHLEPEFMTSFAAARFQGKNAKIDSSAAALILQSFLDTRRGGGEARNQTKS